MTENLDLIRIAVQIGLSFAMTIIVAAGTFSVILCVAGTG